MAKLPQDEEDQQKDILWYQSTVATWYQNRMEGDKQVLTLSGLGIGLLMALKGNLPDGWHVILWCASAFCFFMAMLLILDIFKKNSDYIMEIIKDQDSDAAKNQGRALASLTTLAFSLFLIGAFLTIILALKGINFFPNAGVGQ